MTLNTPLCDVQRIALEVVGDVTIITSKLSSNTLAICAHEHIWETVVFYSQVHSFIVETYTTWADAVLGHAEWVDHYLKEDTE